MDKYRAWLQNAFRGDERPKADDPSVLCPSSSVSHTTRILRTARSRRIATGFLFAVAVIGYCLAILLALLTLLALLGSPVNPDPIPATALSGLGRFQLHEASR